MNKLFARVTSPRAARADGVATAPVPGPGDTVPQARVFVRDLDVMAVIGIYPHEQRAAQRLRVNLDLAVADRGGPRRDQIADVVSYEDGVRIVRETAQAGHLNLVETFAERVAERLLADHRVLTATVRVEKLDVFPDAASAGIEITRQRA